MRNFPLQLFRLGNLKIFCPPTLNAEVEKIFLQEVLSLEENMKVVNKLEKETFNGSL